MKIAYISKKFRSGTMALIEIANDILSEYQAQGYDLTLRQLYYQMVARDILPNSQRDYKRLGKAVSNGRLAGLIDWTAIVDRTRVMRGTTHWDDPQAILKSAEENYRIDKWSDQAHRVEVWVEKDALVGIVGRVADDLDIDYFSCRGYTSQTAMWKASIRLSRYQRDGQVPVILHLADHDPSGVDMTRDIVDRMETFGLSDCWMFYVKRIALTMDQVRQYRPPPNPAKLSDSRAEGYIREYGYDSWELDALEPQVLYDLIEDETLAYLQDDRWQAMVKKEKQGQDHLRTLRLRGNGETNA